MLEHRRQNPSVRVIDIATRWTPTSDHSDLYIEIRPGSDLALANGLLHLLVADGQIDRAFVDENVVFRRGIEDLESIGYGCYGADGTRAGYFGHPRL